MNISIACRWETAFGASVLELPGWSELRRDVDAVELLLKLDVGRASGASPGAALSEPILVLISRIDRLTATFTRLSKVRFFDKRGVYF